MINSNFLRESILQSNVNSSISTLSNLGSSNPLKGPTAKSLFYDAAKRKPSKYGQFLFYSLGSYTNDFIQAYYLSERTEYNSGVSSVQSRNPTAGFLVNQTSLLEESLINNQGNNQNILSSWDIGTNSNSIIGGISAPYYWKDFLYCKYYGAIPNNYMITLRRYPNPVLDNMSIPDSIKNSDAFKKQGIGRPVAQAVTWWGGNTSNSLSSIINFASGLEWETTNQDEIKEQQAWSKGLFQDGPANIFKELINVDVNSGLGGVPGKIGAGLDVLAIGLDDSQSFANSIRARDIRDKAKEKEFGLLNEYIWVPVDVVKQTYYRNFGLSFTWNDFAITFEYDLTSVGEVNTKASILDILGNLLSIGTNYGNFLAPDVRYNTNFPPIGFPGGEEGLALYYKDPINWFIKYGRKISNLANQTIEGEEDNQIEKTINEFSTILKDKSSSDDTIREFIEGKGSAFGKFLGNLVKTQITTNFIKSYQAPISLLTGAPIGEWHLTIGNPCNPIAMIGNLICKNVDISFSENLGPDDFPTSIKAVFTLAHGRDRERGEIESIFNRGDGRLYQSALTTSASEQSFDTFTDTNGNSLRNMNPDDLLSQDGPGWLYNILSEQ